ncbi:MAG: hypothetical protein WC707_00065 [Candidatus Babeliaceae bacterium]
MKNNVVFMTVVLCAGLSVSPLQCGKVNYDNINNELRCAIGNQGAFKDVYHRYEHSITNDSANIPVKELVGKHIKEQMEIRNKEAQAWDAVKKDREDSNFFKRATADVKWRKLGAGFSEAVVAGFFTLVFAKLGMKMQDPVQSGCAGLFAAVSAFFVYHGAGKTVDAVHHSEHFKGLVAVLQDHNKVLGGVTHDDEKTYDGEKSRD